MELTCDKQIETLIAGCMAELSEVEAAFVKQHYLGELKLSLAEFASQWRLSKKAMDDLRCRVAGRTKELLAEQQIYPMKDIV